MCRQVQQGREHLGIHILDALGRGGSELDCGQLGHILRHRLEPGDGQAGAGPMPQDRSAEGGAYLTVDLKADCGGEYFEEIVAETTA